MDVLLMHDEPTHGIKTRDLQICSLTLSNLSYRGCCACECALFAIATIMERNSCRWPPGIHGRRRLILWDGWSRREGNPKAPCGP